MVQRIAVVTGGNKGIGYEVVKGLCQRFDGVVYLTARNVEKGVKAVEDLKRQGLHPEFHQLDIENEGSIVALRDDLKKKHGGLDLLINNAGVMYAKSTDFEKAQKTMNVNYYAQKKVCEILFPILNTDARVVNVSSSAGQLGRIPSRTVRKKFMDRSMKIDRLDELMEEYLDSARRGTSNEDGWGPYSYFISKLGLNILTFIQQRDWGEKGITINAVHPGFVNTDINEHTGTLTVQQGAQPILYTALDAPDSVKGSFVWCDNNTYDWCTEELLPQCT